MTQPNGPKKDWYIAGASGATKFVIPKPVVRLTCTAEERAIIDAARKAQAALDTPGSSFKTMWEAAVELRAAIHAADAAAKEARDVG